MYLGWEWYVWNNDDDMMIKKKKIIMKKENKLTTKTFFNPNQHQRQRIHEEDFLFKTTVCLSM